MTSTRISPARAQRRRIAGNRQDNADVRSGIWVVHAIGDRARVALLGDLRHEHFYYTEGDPSVDSAEYNPPPVATTLDGAEDSPVLFDALVVRTDGTRECRLVVSAQWDAAVAHDRLRIQRHQVAARRLGAAFVLVTSNELDAHRVRISNWPRVIGAHLRCRHRSLSVVQAAVNAAIPVGAEITIDGVLQVLRYEEPALVLAAVASLLRARRISSDLDARTWSRFTRLKGVTP